MELSNQQAERLVQDGVAALRAGRPGDARQNFEAITRTGRANAQIWLLLAVACRGAGDAAAEEAALDALLAAEPRAARGLVMKGDCRANAGDERSALAHYESALIVAASQEMPPDLVAELRRAEQWVDAFKARANAQREAGLSAQGFPVGQRSARFQQSLDILSGKSRIFVQEPTGYYFPGLAPIAFFDTADFDWVPAIEAASAAIRQEIAALLAGGMTGFRPYIQSEAHKPRLDGNDLLDSSDWSTLFLCENGQEFADVIARCPRTWGALKAVPMPQIANSPTVMFSLLRPGARIAPHTGTHNARLICHLPLIIPPRCGFRVGSEVREWEEGKLLIFDDSIEHEAWNDSDQDRVVLIFDVWRPELTAQERSEVAALFRGPSAAPSA